MRALSTMSDHDQSICPRGRYFILMVYYDYNFVIFEKFPSMFSC